MSRLSKLSKESIELYGPEHQVYVVIEEAAEFTAIASKTFNRNEGKITVEYLKEVADLIIVTEHLKQMYKEVLPEILDTKLDKLEGHLQRKRAKHKQLVMDFDQS